MAQSIHGESRPRQQSRRDIGQWVAQGRVVARQQLAAMVAAFRQDPWQAAWLLLWSPFWLGSVTQAPPPRWRTPASLDPTPTDEAGQYLTASMDKLTRRIGWSWVAGSILRGVSLAIIVFLLWTVIAAVGGHASPGIPAFLTLLGTGVTLGAIHGRLAWPNRTMVARMLDRSFWLDERMVTAFERPSGTDRLSRIQVADAANTFAEIVPEIPRSTWIPVREGVLGLALIGTLALALLTDVSHNGIGVLETAPVPQYLTASDRLATQQQPVQTPPVTDPPAAEQASIADIQERGRRSQSTREDLGTLGEALAKHPLTQPAAEAIATGEYGEAASMLEQSAESVAAMDQAERDALADDLDKAASDISETNPELAQQARDTADSVRVGGPEAADSVRDLADQVRDTSENVESQEDMAQELDEATSNSGSGESSAGSEGEQSSQSQGSGEQSEGSAGAGTDPGEGVAAQPGVANQEQASDSGSASEPGQGEGSTQEGAGSAASDEATGDQSGEAGSGDGTSSESGSGQNSGEGEKQTISGAPDDEQGTSQGSGAGTGQSNANDQGATDTTVDDPAAPEENPDAEIPGAGKAGDPPPSRSDRGEEDDGRGSTSTGTQSLQLEGTSDESVQAGGNTGTSSTGSGSDSSTASGDLQTGDAGEAGPDSNRVPAALRDIVKGYFNEQETP